MKPQGDGEAGSQAKIQLVCDLRSPHPSLVLSYLAALWQVLLATGGYRRPWLMRGRWGPEAAGSPMAILVWMAQYLCQNSCHLATCLLPCFSQMDFNTGGAGASRLPGEDPPSGQIGPALCQDRTQAFGGCHRAGAQASLTPCVPGAKDPGSKDTMAPGFLL